MKYLISTLAMPLLFASFSAAAESPNYDDHIKPLLRKYCLKCHGDDDQQADINMQSFTGVMRGGSGGALVVAGRSSQSLLVQIITDSDPAIRMPPESPAMPDAEVQLIRQWIDSGLRESATSKSMTKSRDISFQPAAGAGGRPESPAMPEALPEISVPKVVHPLPVLAMAASPWAPLVAVAAQNHIRLFNTETEEEIGQLPFPDGEPHVIRFSRDGNLLMVAGGRPVESGRVVLFDVKTGRRLAEIGDEIDAVLAADISADQTLVALGGTGRVVKVYSTKDGKLQHKLEKHTDWITSLAFSPEGHQLVSGDRTGAIHLWDAASGGILLNLSEHKATVTSLDWRTDGKLLASAGEDGSLIWWDAGDGFPVVNRGKAHPPARPADVPYGEIPNGVLSARFDASGNLISCGRDQHVRTWKPNGTPLGSIKVPTGLPISVATSSDAKVIAGDLNGNIHFWPLSK
ncbi:WD domain, G-beta repeat [Rosistilla carotiformis]|uniref:WD domain, G-beta repeat n=1 Tax=Rosistilla carotiformis TaxID=2528017 RepID=A0A518JP92_9BACT|nr:c-type cytochrome domain-containing protein [Rosistilla carotiformis]QDV67343.1 WD domain, G-beta repeat [Rosistilla carotiformis]